MINNFLLKEFGGRVRQLRTDEKLSQEQLSYKTGFHRTYIGMIERAERNITLGNIERISIALNIPITKLLD